MNTKLFLVALLCPIAARAEIEMELTRGNRGYSTTQTYKLDNDKLALSLPVADLTVEMLISDQTDTDAQIKMAAIDPEGMVISSVTLRAEWGQEITFDIDRGNGANVVFAFTLVKVDEDDSK